MSFPGAVLLLNSELRTSKFELRTPNYFFLKYHRQDYQPVSVF
jgi:hypothetical protein